jgi:hypothetical protein
MVPNITRSPNNFRSKHFDLFDRITQWRCSPHGDEPMGSAGNPYTYTHTQRQRERKREEERERKREKEMVRERKRDREREMMMNDDE